MPSVVRNHKRFITAGTTSGKLAVKFPQNLILACYTDAMQGTAATRFAVQTLHASQVIVIENTQMQYAINVTNAFIKELQLLKGQLITKISFTPDTLKIDNLINKMSPLKKGAIAIYFASGVPKTLEVIKQLRQAGFEQPIIGADGFDSDTIVKAPSTLLIDVYFTTHAVLSPNDAPASTLNSIQHYQQKYTVLPKNAFTTLGHDVTMLAAELLAGSKNQNPPQLDQWLSTLKLYSGASGDIRFHGGNVPNKNIYIIQINKNQRQLASIINI
ncbi:ABC transporter substrate-binding protein [Shewanella surugensis]|uniref:ABC transporter substrate-binding protein n=1 Tax=Shewanella surugensis TaxID=212020 RepID=A0ABT0LBM4_9GAMM|nr:ABC transporter substrate-binding protein [Shewanella surugensis]MCL1125101.1 ABC transporter substrate-binding protein [Shewanella surugensis]